MSIEQVAHRAQSDFLPEPTLDLAAFRASVTALPPEALNASPTSQSPPDSDPWRLNIAAAHEPPQETIGGMWPGYTVGSSTSGLGRNWWKQQRKVEVTIIPEKQGFILARYTAYLVTSDVSAPESLKMSLTLTHRPPAWYSSHQEIL